MFPNDTLFSEIPMNFEITASQTLIIVRSVLNFFYIGRHARITSLEYLKRVIENIHVANYSDLPIKLRATTHIDLNVEDWKWM